MSYLKPLNMLQFLSIAICLGVFSSLQADSLRIVFLGDSLTAGYGLDESEAYPALVGKMLESDGHSVDIINAGVSGDTSAGGARRINWLTRQPIDILVLALGANDALRGQDASGTQANLERIIESVREAHPDVQILLAGILAPPNMGTDFRKQFDAIYPQLARAHEVHLLPFLLEGVAGQPELNLADGIHPNQEGQQKVAELVYDKLSKVITFSM